MYKYIFTHTHIGFKLVEDVSAKLQQKQYWYDSDKDIKNIKTRQWHQLWTFPSREQILLKLFHLLQTRLSIPLSWNDWRKQNKTNSCKHKCFWCNSLPIHWQVLGQAFGWKTQNIDMIQQETSALPGPLSPSRSKIPAQLSSCSPPDDWFASFPTRLNPWKKQFYWKHHMGLSTWCTEGKLPEFIPTGVFTCLGTNLPHPAAPDTKPPCPETHTTYSHGEKTQNCCIYSSCLHEGRAASPVNLKSLRCKHTAGTSDLSCDISGKSGGWEHLLPGGQFLWSMLLVPLQ